MADTKALLQRVDANLQRLVERGSLCSAALGIYLADRQLFKRGK